MSMYLLRCRSAVAIHSTLIQRYKITKKATRMDRIPAGQYAAQADNNVYQDHAQQQPFAMIQSQYASQYGNPSAWPSANFTTPWIPQAPPPTLPFFPPFDMSRNYHTASHAQSAQSTTLPIRRNHEARPRSPHSSSKPERNVAVPPQAGIPDPSQAYLARSLQQYTVLHRPQHLLVIIDLNGTLLHRPKRQAPTQFTARPHTPRFLNYCITTFTVVIWSSARPENVKAMTNSILSPKLKHQVVAIWGRDKFDLTPAEYNNKVQCYKQLDTVWNDATISKSHPAGRKWDQTNTVLIDDSNYKGKSEPYNMVEIPEFSGGKTEEVEGEGVLPQVHDYLNRLSMCDNVSAYMRRHPFAFVKGMV